MKLFCGIVLILWAMAAAGQSKMTGQVIDGESGAPVAGSSVFITNTSLAGITNGEGYFEIADIPPGNYRLVITNVGFETVVYDFSTDRMPPRLKVIVKPRLVTLEPVIVGGYVTETWEKWGKTFTNYFIGQSENSTQTKIKNHEIIRFRYYKNEHKLQVVATEPIVIENRALGYKIVYQLEHFEISFKEKTNFFAGYILFTALKGNSRQVKKWAERRKAAFTGSMTHFFRSVYENNLQEQGFEVRRVKKIRNLEKDRVRTLYRTREVDQARDSAGYYERVLSQKDYSYEYGAALLTVDSFSLVQNQERWVTWSDHLQVVNKNKLEEQRYLDQQFEKRGAYPARSLICLQHESALQLDANGNWYPAEGLLSEWYWAWSEKVGDMLPLNYVLPAITTRQR